MEKWKKRSVELITSLAFGSKSGNSSVVPYNPQKTECSAYEMPYFSRSTPERHGVSSKRIYNMLCELEAERRANIHNLIVIKDGEVITECSRDGYGINTWHLSHSMSKTVTGMAIGMLVDDGLLELSERLVDIFPDVPYRDKRFPEITVEHLLAMTSGVSFNEAGTVTEYEWTKAFFASSVKFVPGTSFAYNSMNSYILARIVVKLSGKSLTEFLRERLFAPLEIKNYFWEIGPEGVEKGGWGLYLSVESWAKIGQMLLSWGVFHGHRVLSAEWIERSTAAHAVAPNINGDFNYGYQLWVGRSSEEILFNGMLGQNVWICPRNNLVAVIVSGNNELFQASPALDIIRKYLGAEIEDELYRRDVRILHERETRFLDNRRWVTPLEKKHGVMYWLGLRNRAAYDTRWDDLLGEYVFGENEVGMLPLFVRAMQNNLASRIEKISFERQGSELYMIFVESGVEYRLQIGLYEYKSSRLDFRGEKYLVRVMGEAVIGPDGEAEYRIELLFPELPNTRMISISKPSADRIVAKFIESPNDKILDSIIARMPIASTPLAFALDLLEKRFGETFIQKKLSETFGPTLVGANIASESCDDIIMEQNAIRAEESGVIKLVRGVVDKFFKENGEENVSPVDPQTVKQRSFIGDLMNKIGITKKEKPKETEQPKDTAIN